MNAQVYITSSKRSKSASRSVKPDAAGQAEAGKSAYHAKRYGARERFIYLAATRARDVVKVGSSCNPRQRTSSMTLGSHVLGETPCRIWRFSFVQAWSLGTVTFSQAIAAEYAVHAALRALRPEYATEWYRLDADVAAEAISQHLQKAGA